MDDGARDRRGPRGAPRNRLPPPPSRRPMRRSHLRGSRRRGRPTTEPTLQRLEDLDHFTARLAPAAGAHLALRRRGRATSQSGLPSPPSIWPFLISLWRFQHAVLSTLLRRQPMDETIRGWVIGAVAVVAAVV